MGHSRILIELALSIISIAFVQNAWADNCGKVPTMLQLPKRSQVYAKSALKYGPSDRCGLYFSFVCLPDGVPCDFNNQCCNSPCNGECARQITEAEAKSDAELDPDLGTVEEITDESYLEAPQVITKHGYPFEAHEVTTDDGYILSVFRIPYGRKAGAGPRQGKRVIWLQHGLAGDSSNYLYNTVDKALAYVMADRDFDVWLGNARGSRYSQKHKTLDPNKKEFWDFSFHEMGLYDVPAVLKHILTTTGQKQIDYAGHSMGSAMFFIAMQAHPELNSYIRLFNGLAPAAYVSHLRTPLVRSIVPVLSTVKTLVDSLQHGELNVNFPATRRLTSLFCRDETPSQGLCMDVIFELVGPNVNELNTTMLPMIMGHFPGTLSTKSAWHYITNVRGQTFSQFDYGAEENLKRYGTAAPPRYDLSKVTCPVAIWYGPNDWLVGPEDALQDAAEMPNVVHTQSVGNFNHMDFLWAVDIDKQLFEPMLKLIDSFP